MGLPRGDVSDEVGGVKNRRRALISLLRPPAMDSPLVSKRASVACGFPVFPSRYKR